MPTHSFTTRIGPFMLVAALLASLGGFVAESQPPASPKPVAPAASSTMKAVRVHSSGGVDVFKYEDAPRPEPKDGELLIRVIAAGVNPASAKFRAFVRSLTEDRPINFGWDIAGIVESTGPTAAKFKKGDAIFAALPLLTGGGYAEFVIVDENIAVAKPKSLTFVEAAAVPVTAMTAWQALVDAGGVTEGQTVLIQGGSGGIGTFAVQIAKAKGAKVIAVASTANQEYLKELGADIAIDYKTQNFEDIAKEAGGVDLVLDIVGGDTQKRSFNVLKKGGVLISVMGDPDQNLAKEKGVTAKSIFVESDTADLAQIVAMIDAGQIKVTVSKVLPLADAAKAHEQVETGHTRGKIVLKVAEEPA